VKKSVSELKSDLVFIEKDIARLACDRDTKKQEIANLLCPFNIGDKIIKTTMPFTILVIDKILYSGFSDGYKILGFKIKKDGNKYKYSSEVWSPSNYILCEVD